MASLWRHAGRCWSRPSILPPYRSQIFVIGRLSCMARQYALRQSINNRPRGAQRESPISRMPASSSHAQRYISNGPPRPHSPKQALVDAKEADAVASNFRRMALSDIAYAIGAGILVFGGAVFLARTDTRSLIRATPTIKPSIEGLRATRIRRELLASQRSVNKFRKYINKGLLEYYISWRKTWVNTSDSKRAAYLLVSANLVVFLAWQAVTRGPSLGGSARVFMTRWFVHRPLVVNRLERVITPVTSLFSHQVPLHFLFNMVALTSFSTSAGLYLSSRNVQDGKEYSYRDQQELSGIFHFLAFFVSAGVFASLGGVAHATVLVRKVLRSHPVDFAAYLRVVQSGGLGASGAVFAVFTVATLAHPDTQVALIFVPFVPIAAKYVLMGAVGLDICGLLAGWRYFGHASHLGGVAFGALYFHYGPQMWKAIRGPERAEYLLPRPI